MIGVVPLKVIVPLRPGTETDFVKVKVTQSCPTLCDPNGLYGPCHFLGQSTGVGSVSLLQGIFPTQGSNPGLTHCRRILHQLIRKGNPRIQEWVAYLTSGSSQPKNHTNPGVPCVAGRFFTTELSGKLT